MDKESIMPFGKYKGLRLSDVPTDHLFYLEGEIRKKSKTKRSLTEALLLKYIDSKKIGPPGEL